MSAKSDIVQTTTNPTPSTILAGFAREARPHARSGPSGACLRAVCWHRDGRTHGRSLRNDRRKSRNARR